MSNCSCVLVEFEDGEAKCFVDKSVVARKKHVCCECQDEILPGESYWLYEGMYDDRFFRNRTCKVCEEICKVFFCAGHVFEMMYEDLAQHISDNQGEISSECINSMSEKAKARVLDMIDVYIDEKNV